MRKTGHEKEPGMDTNSNEMKKKNWKRRCGVERKLRGKKASQKKHLPVDIKNSQQPCIYLIKIR